MGPGFGGINIGGFALPDINMEEVNAGIASQLGPEIAKYLAEQELAAATNEYEKDAAETKVEQIKEFEAGLGSLPPVVEQVMQKIQSGQGIASGYEGDGYEDYINYEPQDPIQEIIEQIIETSPEPSRPDPEVIMERDDPVMPIDPYYNPSYMGFVDERKLGKDDEAQYILNEPYIPPDLTPPDIIDPIIEEPIVVPPPPPPPPEDIGGYDDIITLPPTPPEEPVVDPENPYNNPYYPFPYGNVYAPEVYGQMDPSQTTGSEAVFDPGYRKTNPAITNLINQQREQYNQALQNAVYKAPDTVQEDYVRPMSAAEFGSVPGRYTPPTTARPFVDPREQNVDTDLGFIAMNRGGTLNNNMGLGGLPQMQQNDKLTQLFAQSFRPRR
tara:strand:- start:1360 stop:2511 length:1152 start_codon:yes stop_codon:yes gene_type:complete